MDSLPQGFALDEQPSALPPGFELDEEKYGGLGGELKAFAAGAARGATFGLSDQALVHSGLVEPHTLKGLEEENPTASLVGEIGGTVAPMLVGDVAGAANLPRLAAKVGAEATAGVASVLPKATTLAGKVATGATATGAGLAAEGALYGLGQAVSENALGDHELLSEKTLANVGLAAALGGGFGALIGGVSAPFLKDASKGLEKIEAQKISQAMSFEENAIAGNVPAKEKLSVVEELLKQKENAPEIIKAGEFIGAPVTPGQTSASKYIQDAESALSKAPTFSGVAAQQQVQKGFDAVDNVIKESLDTTAPLSIYDSGSLIKSQIQKTVDDMYAPLKSAYKAREELGEVVKIADKERAKFYDRLVKQSQEVGSRGGPLENKVRSISERFLAQNSIREMDALLTELRSEATTAFRAGDSALGHAISGTVESIDDFMSKQMIKSAVKEARKVIPGGTANATYFRDINASAQKAEYKELIKAHKETQKQYREFKNTLADLFSDQRLGRGKNVTYGMVDDALSKIPNEKILDKMFDPKNADGLLRLKEKFPDIFKTLVDQKKSQLLQQSMKDGRVQIGAVMRELFDEKKMSSKVREVLFTPKEMERLNASKIWVEALPKDINPSGTSKAEAFRELVTNPFKGTLDNLSSYAAKKLIEKFAGTSEELARGVFLLNAERTAAKTAKRIQTSVAYIFENTKTTTPNKVFSKVSSQDDYQEKTNEIKNLVNNPIDFSDKIAASTEDVYGVAPNIAQSLQNSMVRGIQFLNSKIPPSNAGIFDTKKVPSQSEMSQFARYYNIVQDPLLALEQVKSSTLTKETIETLSLVYPKLYNQMKEEALDHLSGIKDPLKIPFKKRQSLSMFLGMPLDQAFSPIALTANQMTFAVSNQQEASKQAGFSKSQASKLTVAKRTELYHGQPED